MNKKGFTLVELVITIALLGVLGMVIVSNMSGILNKEQDKQYDLFKSTLTKAACSYIHLNAGKTVRNTCVTKGKCSVAVNVLLEQGLISDDDLIDPRKQAKISSKTYVAITYQNNEFTCSVDSLDSK
mgnify:CR=1 FL=1